jgi:predicted transcriptional regulator
MAKQKGSLTGPQFEILQLLWDRERAMSVSEIWEEIRLRRDISRTTILNLVDRLEKRHWLTRQKDDGSFRYQPAVKRESTEEMLAKNFLGEFFDGSPSNFLLSLLGSRRVSKTEVDRLKKLLDEKTSPSKTSKPATGKTTKERKGKKS